MTERERIERLTTVLIFVGIVIMSVAILAFMECRMVEQ